MSVHFNGVANKWMDSPPRLEPDLASVQRERERGRRMTAVIGTGESVTFDSPPQAPG